MGEDERIVLLVTLCIKLFTNSTGKSVKNNVLQALFCCFPRLHWKNDSITPNIKMLIWKHDLFNITHFGRKKKKKKREIEVLTMSGPYIRNMFVLSSKFSPLSIRYDRK